MQLPLALIASLALLLSACADADPKDLGSAPYAGSLELTVGTTLDWTRAAGDYGSIEAAHFEGGKGTLTFEGTALPAIVYKRIPFPPYDLAAVVATTPSGFVVAYAYCQDGIVQSWYLETLDRSTRHQTKTPPSGSCTFVDGANPIDVRFLPPTGPPSLGALADVADVDGPMLQIHGGTGTITLAGQGYGADVFTEVDCSACGGAGWMELHLLIRDAQTRAFGILYLVADMPGTVTLAYGFRFDEPALWPADQAYTATWALK